MESLHITNGDVFTERLKALGIKGEIITWREMLCEGQTLSHVGSEHFWKTRFDFLHKHYKISKSFFIEKTLKEYRSLCNHKKQDDIVLWFGSDLFCQINMLGVLSWLKAHRHYAQISMVTTGKTEQGDAPYDLDRLPDDQVLKQYEHKKTLSQDDVELADYLWQLYCSDAPMRLESLPDFNRYGFDHLDNAIRAHLKRFPTIKNGLNQMENDILDLGQRSRPQSKEAFLNQIKEDQGALGFGASQYGRAVARLKPLFTSLNPVKLSRMGKKLLERQTNYYANIQDNQVFLGGALKYDFLYNTDTNRILKL